MKRNPVRSRSRQRSCEEVLADALQTAWRRYARARHACRRKPSAKHVHAFRVASRQLLAIVTPVAAAAGTDAAKIRKRLKRGLRATAEIRDVDAQLPRATALLKLHPLLHSFVAKRMHERRRLADAVSWELADLHVGRRVRQLGEGLFDEYPDGSADQAFRAAFAAALMRTGACLARRGTSAKTLHRTRLAIKRLRYMSEAIPAMLPGGVAPWAGALHRRQQRLGDIRDLGAFLERLRHHRSATAAERRELRRIAADLIAERRVLLGREAQSGPLLPPRALRAWLEGADRGKGCATNAKRHGAQESEGA